MELPKLMLPVPVARVGSGELRHTAISHIPRLRLVVTLAFPGFPNRSGCSSHCSEVASILEGSFLAFEGSTNDGRIEDSISFRGVGEAGISVRIVTLAFRGSYLCSMWLASSFWVMLVTENSFSAPWIPFVAILFTGGRFVSKSGEVRFSVGIVLSLLVVFSFSMCEAEVRGGVSSCFISLG